MAPTHVYFKLSVGDGMQIILLKMGKNSYVLELADQDGGLWGGDGTVTTQVDG